MTSLKENILLHKLDAFIRKYYANQLIRGVLIAAALLLIVFLTAIISEYLGHYGQRIRMLIFYTVVCLGLFSLAYYIIRPLMGLYRIGKVISYTQAASIVGTHFSDVQDVLLNALQLQEKAEANDSELILAAIQQKTEQLKPIPFERAIDISVNKKYVPYLILPLVVLLAIAMYSPGLIGESALHLVRYDTVFAEKAPFQFKLQANEFNIEPFSDIELDLNMEGEKLPDQVQLVLPAQEVRMQKVNNHHFKYTLRNIHDDCAFYFSAAGFTSGMYAIHIIRKPQIISYSIHISYPPYLHRTNEQLENPGDFQVPVGSVLTWNIHAKHTDSMQFTFPPKRYWANSKNENYFEFNRRMMQSEMYQVRGFNETGIQSDSMSYRIEIIPDAFPQIEATAQADSIQTSLLYFAGQISDDIGLHDLYFCWRFVKSEQNEKRNNELQREKIQIDPTQNPQRFYVVKNIKELGAGPGDELEYYFEVRDNDAVHGSKATRSQSQIQRNATVSETRAEAEQANDKMKQDMSETVRELKELNRDLKQFRQKLPEKKELSWEDKRNAEKLVERQQQLEKKLSELNKKFKFNSEKQKQDLEQQKEMIEKQEMIQKMYDELMSPEMKQMLKQLEETIKQQNKDQLRNELDKMQLSNKEVEKELDRMLEMFKAMEVEKKAEDVTKRLDELSEKQQKLSEDTRNKNKSEEQLKSEQQKIKEELKDIQKTYQDALQENDKLEEKKELPDLQQEQQQAGEKMEQSSKELDKGNEKKAADKQKEAADKMKDMAQKIRDKMQEQEEKDMELDMRSLREILDDLIRLSKDQENVMLSFGELTGYNPKYVELAQQQKTLRDHAQMIEDSLFALSKRAPQISSFINKEAGKMRDRLQKSVEDFSERNFPMIRNDQQYVMTHANNLALLLSEVMQQMQQQQQQQQSGQGKTGKSKRKGKPGNGKPSMSELRKMQDELNKQLKEGLNKQNGSGKPGQGMNAEEFARSAAQQMAIRQKLQQMMNEMGRDGQGKEGKEGKEGQGGQDGNSLRNELNQMKQMMEQTERELFNKRLTSEMLRRQQDITTRMLESEKAEKQQDQDKKREAEKAKEPQRKNPPPALEPFLRRKEQETELLKSVPAELQPYYREKTKNYLHQLPQ